MTFSIKNCEPLARVAQPDTAALARGLAVVGDHVFVGVSPASILCIDWPRGLLVDVFQYSDQVTAAVHGLVVVP